MDVNTFNRLIHCFKEDVVAFENIYTYYFPRIKIFIDRKYIKYNLGEDIAQEFFMKLFRITIPEKIKSPTIWIFNACDNLAKSMIMSLESDKAFPLSEETLVAADIDENLNILRHGGISKENIELLNKLDDLTVEIFVMYFWEGFNYKEISEKLGIGYSRIRQKVSRALRKLKKYREFVTQFSYWR